MRLAAMVRLVIEELRQHIAPPLRIGLPRRCAVFEIRREIRLIQPTDKTSNPRVLGLARRSQGVEVFEEDLVQPRRPRALAGETPQPDPIDHYQVIQRPVQAFEGQAQIAAPRLVRHARRLVVHAPVGPTVIRGELLIVRLPHDETSNCHAANPDEGRRAAWVAALM